MSINNIYCFGDGYALGHIWPEWPQILQALLPECKVSVIAGVGAGPEWLVTRLVQELEHMHNSTVIFQWPQSNRFDKLVTDQRWQHIGQQDPVYHFNFHSAKQQTWWLSSASDHSDVRQYHKTVQLAQHQQRLDNYQILVRNTLENIGCHVVFTSTHTQEQFSKQTQFSNIRQQQVQPSPLVHFYFVKEVLLPQLKQKPVAMDRLRQLIVDQSWIAYDPDRESIWQQLCIDALDHSKVDHNGLAQTGCIMIAKTKSA
jgi:hypothetical protein